MTSQPKFKKGDVIRIGDGETALMLITDVVQYRDQYRAEDGVRYYGSHCMGGSAGVFEGEASEPSPEDLKLWGLRHAD